MSVHPFIKYGQAVVLRQNNLTDLTKLSKLQLVAEIESCANHFRLKPDGQKDIKGFVKFNYGDDQKGNPEKGIYLGFNILATDMGAKNVFAAFSALINELQKSKPSMVKITKGLSPIAGEFTNFGPKSIGRGAPKTSVEEAAYCLIATTTEKKPALAFKTIKKNKTERENVAIIPHLDLSELVDFINLFERMKNESTEGLMLGRIMEKDDRPMRPKIYDGNFPNAPRSSSLGAIGLLGAIGSWAKDAEMIKWSQKVLESLKDKPIYLVGTSTFQTFKYNHFVIDLAKENKLSSIVDSVYYTVLYNQGYRNNSNRIEYEKFDLFASRFLQFFNRPTFKDFLSFRAEYPSQFIPLLNKYFINMEKIPKEVVKSARELGKWLNYAAYKVADRSIENNTPNRNEKIRDAKSKSLIEIESSIFSARDGSSLIFQAITRAGRASGLDAPAEAERFMNEASTGNLSLDDAKHLLIAFSRVRNRFEPVDMQAAKKEDSQDEDESEDLSDAQE